SLTRITYSSKLIGIRSLAAFLKLELFRVYIVSWRRDGVEERIEWNNDVEMDALYSIGAVSGLPVSTFLVAGTE
ncbi:hypothetical protein, partial [Pectobacterium aquaticum]|uniref:hypothetical protein n=1 Tax=Pectobacterium aquaticum TaxID=2204145 RepID=UPI001D00D7AA